MEEREDIKMKKFYCDRCGKELPIEKNGEFIYPLRQFCLDLIYNLTGHTLTGCKTWHYDLCEECFEKVRESIEAWIQGEGKRNE